ncbi:MAG: TIGR01777 family oxidoreductase [Desulfonatronovibrionaceae bacterium]
MKYFIAGGTGFIGRFLIEHLLQKKEQVTALVRDEARYTPSGKELKTVSGDPLKHGPWQEEARAADVIINLTGSPIMTNWTEKARQMILDSRVNSTMNIVSALKQAEPRVFICANAVGYYGPRGDEPVYDQDPPGNNFLAQVAVKWQEAAMQASEYGHRVIVPRFPAVLGPNGGALSEMLPIFRKGLGGKLGNGKQWFPWVHITDLVRGLHFVSKNTSISGALNLCSPQTLTNAEFTRALGKVLKRPAFLRVPEVALKMAYGDVATMLLTGQKCIPQVLQENDFVFRFAHIDKALQDIISRWKQPGLAGPL